MAFHVMTVLYIFASGGLGLLFLIRLKVIQGEVSDSMKYKAKSKGMVGVCSDPREVVVVDGIADIYSGTDALSIGKRR